MKRTFNFLLITLMVFTVVSCKKSNNNSPAVVDPNPNILINGVTTDLTGVSRALYLGNSNLDSIVILNTGSTDSSLIKNLSSTPTIQTPPNFLQIYLTSNNSISTTSYTIGSGNVVHLIVVAQINGQRYGAATNASVTIDTLSFSRIVGRYTATVVNGSTFVISNISGKFNANITP